MTHAEFLRFEQQLVTLCGHFGVFIKDIRLYVDRPQDNLHFRDILLRAKINERLHHVSSFIEDITETKPK